MKAISNISGVDPVRLGAANQVMQTLTDLMASHDLLEESRAKELGLNLAEARLLLFFDDGKQHTVKHLAEILNVTKGRITRITDGLVKKKLVERVPDDFDGRVIRIKLTPSGEERLYDLKVKYWEAFDSILASLSFQKRMVIMAVLNEFSNCLRKLTEENE